MITRSHKSSLIFAVAATVFFWIGGILTTAAPPLLERKCVPFVLYGPKHLPEFARLAPGVHSDIAPTLVRLCAPKGFPFATFGVDLFSTPVRPGGEGNGVVSLVGRRQGLRTG